jgi:hypothetical protein
MTPEQEIEYNHWEDVIHASDLLRDTGITSVARYRNREGSEIFYTHEFLSEDAMEKYIASERATIWMTKHRPAAKSGKDRPALTF